MLYTQTELSKNITINISIYLHIYCYVCNIYVPICISIYIIIIHIQSGGIKVTGASHCFFVHNNTILQVLYSEMEF